MRAENGGGIEVMWNWARAALGAAELLVSVVAHVSYALYMLASGAAADLVRDRPAAEDDDEDKDAAVLDGSVPPIVLVHGIFGFGKGKMGGISYFAGAEEKDDHVLVPDLGALSSVHDRARRLFYYLKGGRVDYGESHSASYGHARYGRDYARGHYPAWDADHPVHLVGHSAGAQVIRLLHQMLHERAFEGHATTSERWVLSVTSLSGALNGSTRLYMDGMRPEDGGRTMRTACLAQIARLSGVLTHWLDIPGHTRYYDFGLGHFGMSRRLVGARGLAELLCGANGRWGPCVNGDWIVPDLTIHGAARINARVSTFPCTFYFSYATRCPTAEGGGRRPPLGMMLRRIHPLLFFRTVQMRSWRYPVADNAPPPYEGYRDEDWWGDNDGALNTFSMTHPRVPVEHPSVRVEEDDDDGRLLRPGVWYYRIVEGDHMKFVINRRRGGEEFNRVYDSIFRNCRRLVVRNAPTTSATLRSESDTLDQHLVGKNKDIKSVHFFQ